TVTFSSTNGATYSGNGAEGVFVASLTGALTVSGITAGGNAGDGFHVNDGGTTASIDGAFSTNGGNGLFLASFGGLVSLSGVTATDNAGGAGANVLGAGSFSDTGSSFLRNKD